jgi:hypothetical protein
LQREELNALELTANEYPVEAAEALRISIGRDRYHKVLRQVTRKRDTRGERMANAIGALVELGINLIVTFNYTRDLQQVLPPDREVIVIQRNHLPGWSKLDLLHPEGKKIHILAMRGVVDEQLGVLDSAILDSRSYDAVMFSDFHYADVLQRLFQDYTVVSIGLSWKDVMLRHSAARVHYSSPLYGRTHAAILPRAQGAGARKRDIWQERSLVSAYSLRPLYYDPANRHAELVTLLDEFTTLVIGVRSNAPPPAGAPGIHVLATMAETLDACGDHECVFHREWFGAHWARSQAALEAAAQCNLTTSSWIALARIERHLRHFLWAYVAPERRDDERKRLWTMIAEIGMQKYRAGELREWSTASLALALGAKPNVVARGLFDFSLGAYEVFYDADENEAVRFWRSLLEDERCPDIVRPRVEIAKQVWRPETKENENTLAKLRDAAIRCGWEGIEAKIVLGKCELMFREARRRRPLRDLPETQRKRLLDVAMDAREVARLAGSGGRELGAVALGSLVQNPGPAEAELVGVHRGFAKRIEAGAGPVGDWGIYVALLATLLDRLDGKTLVHPDQARKWLEERCGRIERPPLVNTNVAAVINQYWTPYHMRAANLAIRVAKIVRADAAAG